LPGELSKSSQLQTSLPCFQQTRHPLDINVLIGFSLRLGLNNSQRSILRKFLIK